MNSIREGNTLLGVNRLFLKESKDLQVPTLIDINHTERFISEYGMKNKNAKLSHMIANIKFHMTQCHAVLLYKTGNIQILFFCPIF